MDKAFLGEKMTAISHPFVEGVKVRSDRQAVVKACRGEAVHWR
jgi:hypothetical protein